MNTRIVLTLTAALCLVGCSQDNATTGSVGATPATPSMSAAPAPTTTSTPSAPATQMTTTASGLKYQVLKHGTGTVSPKATDTVTVNYLGTLLDGTKFDASADHGGAATFPLNGVIPGWTEGVQLMKVGDKFKFEIPANLAYGPQSPSPLIPPNSTLVFEIELLEIK